MIGTIVTWNDSIPPSWRYIYTSEPMIVRACFTQSEHPSDYARKFHPEGLGFGGRLYEVEYKPVNWHHPKDTLRLLIHEKWLTCK